MRKRDAEQEPSGDADPTPTYSTKGRLSRDVFLETSNDILFYFEDEGYEELYLALLKRILPEVPVSDVFCTGGKAELYKELERKPRIVVNLQIFIADLDFDDLLGSMKSDPRLQYLHRYSIENYWLDFEMFVDLIVRQKRRIRKQEVKDKLQSDLFMTKVLTDYEPIARLFAVCQRYRVGMVSTKTKTPSLIDTKTGGVSRQFAERYQAELFARAGMKQLFFAQDEDQFKNALNAALTPPHGHAVYADAGNASHFPGKHILGIFIDHINRTFDLAFNTEDLYEVLSRTLHLIPLAAFQRLRAELVERIASLQGEGTG
jgi:hypothetical protein